MIGTNEEAELIAKWPLNPEEAPDGWKIVGEGTFRRVYLAPSGTVYKKELVKIHGAAGNRSEDVNLRNAASVKIPGWRIAQHHLFETEDGTPIMAMEYVIGTMVGEYYCDITYDDYCECDRPYGKCVMQLMDEPRAYWGLMDNHRENVLIESDGTLVLVDAGN